MSKTEALALIDGHVKQLWQDPDKMLRWTWLRVIVNSIPEDSWENYLGDALEVLAK